MCLVSSTSKLRRAGCTHPCEQGKRVAASGDLVSFRRTLAPAYLLLPFSHTCIASPRPWAGEGQTKSKETEDTVHTQPRPSTLSFFAPLPPTGRFFYSCSFLTHAHKTHTHTPKKGPATRPTVSSLAPQPPGTRAKGQGKITTGAHHVSCLPLSVCLSLSRGRPPFTWSWS